MYGISNIKTILIRAFFSLLLFFIGTHIALAGFGISPPSIKEDRLVKGSHLEKIIYLVQGNPETDVNMGIVVDSVNIRDWISFDQGMEFTIPAGVQQFPLGVIIDVPQDAEFGIYKAFIRVSTKPERATGAGEVTIALGGRIDVTLTVGEGIIYEYIISGIKIFDVKEGENPKISITVENLGNVPAAPQSASFELFNKYGNIRLAYAEAGGFKEVKAFSKGNSTLEFPIDIRLAPGEYWGHAKVYNEEGQVIKELRTVFNVYKKSLIEKLAIPAIAVLFLALSFLFRKRIFRIFLKR